MAIVPFLVYLATLFATASAPFDAPRPGVDILKYVFDITMSDHSNVIEGVADVTVRFTDGPRGFYLDLVGRGSDDTGMAVDQVSVGDTPIPFEHSEDRLWLNRDGALVDSVVTFSIRYRGVPADGLIISENRFGDRTFFSDNWPNRARHWIPTVDHPADKAFVDFLVTAPDQYQVISNGKLVEETDVSPGFRMSHWHSTAALPTKIMVVGVAKFAVQNVSMVEGVPLQTWVYPQERDKGFYDFAVAERILRYFLQELGSYPYAKLANVQSTTRYGGMENASAIFYNESMVTGTRRHESTVAHEIAHQWFGDSASEANWHHVWLSEGFATYLAHLYLEHRYGAERLAERMAIDRQVIVKYARSNPRASVVDRTIADPNKVLTAYSYEKGGWTLHMLRQRLGLETFWEVLRQYYEAYEESNATTEDFRDVVEAVSGQDLDWFFEQWIYRAGLPDLSVAWRFDEQAGELVIDVDQKQDLLYKLSLDVGLRMESTEVIETLDVSTRHESFRIHVSTVPDGISLDPNVELLALINAD